jgi:hypothetical protein
VIKVHAYSGGEIYMYIKKNRNVAEMRQSSYPAAILCRRNETILSPCSHFRLPLERHGEFGRDETISFSQ